MRSRKDIQTQQGLVSLLGAERRRSHFVVAVAMEPALRAVTRLFLQAKLCPGVTRGSLLTKR
jgi:hypothetical protein